MIRAVLFDLGGTLHTSSSPPGRELWFARRLLERLGDYGISLDVAPEALARSLSRNAEIYKQETQRTLRELPADEIWSGYYLRDFGVSREQLAPCAEELSFLYDYERVRVMRRPHLAETMEALHGMGVRLGVISNIIRIAEQEMNLPPEELAYVGDTISRDVLGTRAAGWKCMIQISNPSIAHRDVGLDPEANRPDYLISDLSEIPAIIARENAR